MRNTEMWTISLPCSFFLLVYIGLEKLSHHNLNLLAELEEVSRTYTGEVLIKCKCLFVYRNP